jgi:hypothetical protein
MSLATIETSTAAARSIAPCAAAIRERVAGFISSCGSDGTTCDAAEIALELSHQTTSARFRELALATRIIDLGERRKTRSGRNAVVWFSAEQGRP